MPVRAEQDIFSALFKWGDSKSKEEDFYSKSLVLVVKRLENYSKEMATNFLNSLFCYGGFKLSNNTWHITDHTGIEHRPDIIVESSDYVAYLEVKVSSPTDKRELLEYRSYLNKKKKRGRTTALFLLTRLGYDNDARIPDMQFSWVKIWHCLGEIEWKLQAETRNKDVAPEAFYLVRNLRTFLKENGMGIEQVSRKAKPKALHDWRKLMALILASCHEAGLEGREIGFEDEGTADESWVGWWFKKERKWRQYWCGFYLDLPSKIAFGLTGIPYEKLSKRMRKDPELKQKLDKVFDWELGNDYAEFYLTLPDDFTSKTAEEQVKFVGDSISNILKHTNK